MTITAIWTAFCDGPTNHVFIDSNGLPQSVEWAFESDSKSECVRRAKRAGWSVVRGVVLCPKCRTANTKEGAE
ncbi:MAG: hypothetical protein Q8M17_10660 [Actinomycetota bacterium]|nr:hypothetical protein [Actinomycetota bacterium]